MLTVVIACGGDGRRWNNHLNVPKHLVTVEGEPLLHRTIRQAQRLGTVHVAGPYDLPERIPLEPEPGLGELNKYYDSRHVWGDRTVILLGDVYYTDDAIDRIGNTTEPWLWVSRLHGSTLTGCPYGEGFGMVFDATHTHIEALFEVAKLYRQGVLHRAAGWEVYRKVAGGDPARHGEYGMRLEIDDWTEDFDYPADYSRWVYNRIQAKEPA